MPIIFPMWRGHSAVARSLCVGFVLVAAAALTLGLLWFLGLPPFRSSVFDAFPPGALDNYLPHDTAAVVTLDVKQLREKGVLKKPLGKPLLQALTNEAIEPTFVLLGVDPLTDIDTARLAFSGGDPGRPFVLLRGRFDRAHFKIGPRELQELKQDGFRLYRHEDATLALAGDTLVICLESGRVVDALHHAAGPVPAKLDDMQFKSILDSVDRKSAIWFAADLASLGQLDPGFGQVQIQPIHEHAITVRGSVICGADLLVEITLEGRSEGDGVALEKHLNEVVKILKGLRSAEESNLPIPISSEFRPLMRLFAESEIERRERTVFLRARHQLK